MLQQSILSTLTHRSNDSTLSVILKDENDEHVIAEDENNIVSTKDENESTL